MANTTSARAFHGKGLLPGERRGVLGLRTQLPSQRLSEVSALQAGALPVHPSSQPFPARRCLHTPLPLLCYPGARKASGAPQHPKSCSHPADTPWPLQH